MKKIKGTEFLCQEVSDRRAAALSGRNVVAHDRALRGRDSSKAKTNSQNSSPSGRGGGGSWQENGFDSLGDQRTFLRVVPDEGAGKRTRGRDRGLERKVFTDAFITRTISPERQISTIWKKNKSLREARPTFREDRTG